MDRQEKFEMRQQKMPNKELAELAQNELSNLCKSGGSSFNMTVPVNIKDTDMLFSELIRRFKELVKMKTPVNIDENEGSPQGGDKLKPFLFVIGENHINTYKEIRIDKDCLIRILAVDEMEARRKMAIDLDLNFKGVYLEDGQVVPNVKYFPRGIIQIDI